MSKLIQLLDAAKTQRGTYGQVAEELGINQTRISEWKKSKYKPDASQLAKLAEMAGWPVLETVAEVETELHPEAAQVWQRALGKLRAAGVAATLTIVSLGSLMASLAAPADANAQDLRGKIGDWRKRCPLPPNSRAFQCVPYER